MIAGPDAGAIIPLDVASMEGPPSGGAPPGGAPIDGTPIDGTPIDGAARAGQVTIGSATGFPALGDDAMDAAHVSIRVASALAVRVRDLATVNGTGVWAQRRGTLVWRGRRHAATVRVGDVIAAGHTLFMLRSGTPESTDRAASFALPAPKAAPHWQDLARPAARRWLRLRRRRTLELMALLDPTAPVDATKPFEDQPPREWLGDITIHGEHPADLARAVILARGRRPPAPSPIAEPWLDWLPPAQKDDGQIRLGSPAPSSNHPSPLVLTGTAACVSVTCGGVVTLAPPVRVQVETAEALARRYAGRARAPSPHEIRWADAAALDHADAYPTAAAGILVGAWLDTASTRWEIRFDGSSPHALIAGMAGSGKSTCLATLACSLAATLRPDELEIVIVCPGDPGPLGPCLDLPHVRLAATHATADEAIRMLSCARGGPRLTVVIADDLHAYGAGGRAVADECERIARDAGPEHVRLLLATTRPAAVLSPRLRAAMTTTVALRAASAADSEDVVGIADAASIHAETPGVALVRASGRVRRALVALPSADRLPAVTLYNDAPDRGRHLAAKALR